MRTRWVCWLGIAVAGCAGGAVSHPDAVTRTAAASPLAVRNASMHVSPAAGESHGFLGSSGPGAIRIVDDFESPDVWTAHPSDGVELAIRPDRGLLGGAMRLDFRFVKGGGYAVARRQVTIDLPDNYRFRFRVRGHCSPNHLEFKLIDSTGANVWWSNQRDFQFPTHWDSVTLKKRHIQFAWGPAGGGEIRRVAAIEFAITAGSGGVGSVWIDRLELTELPPAGVAAGLPRARASTSRPGHGPERALDDDPETFWASAPGDRNPWLLLDLQREQEFGGLVIDWAPGKQASDYDVETSADGRGWRASRTVRGGNGGRDHLYLPEAEARFVRLRARGGATAGIALQNVEVKPLEWSASLEAFLQAIARDAPRGSYPRGISGEQSYWTIVGVDGDQLEALLGEDGALEAGTAQFSIEPFLFTSGRLFTWNDVGIEQSLEQGSLPIPSVQWSLEDLELRITAFAIGPRDSSSVVARYRIRNDRARPAEARLYLALRPFQVNPPSQTLNTPGGSAPIHELRAESGRIRVNRDREVVLLHAPTAFGAVTFDQGDIVEFLRAGRLPRATGVRDRFERASGALEYRFELAPGGEQEVALVVPLRASTTPTAEGAARIDVEREFSACRDGWEKLTRRVTIELPDRDVVRTIESQLAFVLVHRDGPAIQPGSRAYERSWIRDGSLTSSALLRLGHSDVVREFIEWFAPYQYADGKVPCCVDRRGSDPVPEHDSSGEFIFLIAEHHRYVGDSALVARMWPHVAKAATYLDSLRQERRTDEYRAPRRAVFFGLLPPSISHEGYSAQPMHSYWDDFFALRGFKDAAYLAAVLGRSEERRRLAAIGDEFQRELVASLEAAMAMHGIDYLPGAADLGDFDPTSTTIALSPGGAASVLPQAALRRTFERYWEFFRDRRDGKSEWEAFTPYEMRLIGTFVRLGWRDRAHELLQFFLSHRRPPGWAQWAEVVGRNRRAPRFIGDMPHTWVGSDFVRSVLDLLAYEREEDEALVIGAGVPLAWAEEPSGVTVRGLRTPYGPLGFTLRAQGEAIEVRIDGGLRVPGGGIVVNAPSVRGFRLASVNGSPAPILKGGEVVVREIPATIVLRP